MSRKGHGFIGSTGNISSAIADPRARRSQQAAANPILVAERPIVVSDGRIALRPAKDRADITDSSGGTASTDGEVDAVVDAASAANAVATLILEINRLRQALRDAGLVG